ncbi:hypothetical protein AAG570_006223 [Ranatra chinensis]|uniref:Uncharacterized protein n=1 Tax=Ranatra chinensis TaxID=642074 RepID=A0ABD0Z669_9HEMI
MASKRRNMFYENKKQETTEIDCYLAIINDVCGAGGSRMGARQSKRSVDIAGAAAAQANSQPSEERLEKLEEPEVAAKVQNGSPPVADTVSQQSYTIDRNSALNDAKKFIHLPSHLMDDALAVISNFHVPGENYRLALDKLLDRYQNKSRLANLYVSRIRNFTPSKDSLYESLQNFLKVYSNSVNAPRALKLPNLGHYLFFSFRFYNSDPNTQRAYQNLVSSNLNAVPTHEGLIDFVTEKCRNVELYSKDIHSEARETKAFKPNSSNVFMTAEKTSTTSPKKSSKTCVHFRQALSAVVASSPPIEDLTSRFWEIEDTPPTIPPAVNPEDHECEEHFKKTFKSDKSGCYIVSLPFKNGVSIPSSNRAASWGNYKRLEKKLQRDTSKMQEYQAYLKEYLDLGHMSIAQTPSAYVIPHTSGFKKGSNRIRVFSTPPLLLSMAFRSMIDFKRVQSSNFTSVRSYRSFELVDSHYAPIFT